MRGLRRRRGSAATTGPCTRCCRTTRARRTTLERLAAHVPAGRGHAHARARPGRRGRVAAASRCTLDTRIFGALRGVRSLPTGEREGQDPGVDWCVRARLPRPARRARSSSARRRCPERASIQARDGTAIAEGPDRLSDLGPLASEIAGRVGPAPAGAAAGAAPSAASRADSPVGLTGLEREFDERLVRHARRRALRRRPRARPQARAARRRRAVLDRPRSSSAPRSRRWPAATAGSRPSRPSTGEVLGAGRDRAVRAPAAGQRVQDHHARRRAAEQGGQARRELSRSTDRATIEGVEHPERQRRVLRRLAAQLVRALLQQRVRAAGREAGRAEARRDGRGVRLQPGSAA